MSEVLIALVEINANQIPQCDGTCAYCMRGRHCAGHWMSVAVLQVRELIDARIH